MHEWDSSRRVAHHVVPAVRGAENYVLQILYGFICPLGGARENELNMYGINSYYNMP